MDMTIFKTELYVVMLGSSMFCSTDEYTDDIHYATLYTTEKGAVSRLNSEKTKHPRNHFSVIKLETSFNGIYRSTSKTAKFMCSEASVCGENIGDGGCCHGEEHEFTSECGTECPMNKNAKCLSC